MGGQKFYDTRTLYTVSLTGFIAMNKFRQFNMLANYLLFRPCKFYYGLMELAIG